MLANGAGSLQEEFSFPNPDDKMPEPDPDSCPDVRDDILKSKGYQCATYKSVKSCKHCKNNSRWRQSKVCQYSCYQAGCGYDGDICDELREE